MSHERRAVAGNSGGRARSLDRRPGQSMSVVGRSVESLRAAGPSLRDEAGQTLVEYALILVVVAMAIVAAMVFLSSRVSGVFSSIGGHLG